MAAMTIVGTYDAKLVVLSVLIATVASYTALDLAGRINASTGWARHAWFAAAAVAMGGGIWSMHFVAMLAFSMPGMTVDYDIGLTLLSLALPILVTGVGFIAASREGAGRGTILLAGLFMGAGIVAMHYVGMSAMRMAADLTYDPLWVAISVLIAVGAATVAIWLAFRNTGTVQKLVASVAMGAAISGMHYSAMQAAIFTAHHATGGAAGRAGIDQASLALAVAGTTLLILFFSLIAAVFDRRFGVLAEREANALRRNEERFRALYRKTPLPLHSLDANGVIEQVSDAWLGLLGYRREDVIDRPLTNFMTEESARRRVRADWPKLLETGELKDVEYRFVTSAGAFRDVLLSSRTELSADDGTTWVLGGMVDVTARRQAELALRQAQKSEAIGQLTGGVAHDFNTLLAVVLGNRELLRKRLPDEPRLVQLVDNTMQAAQRGVSLTGRMLSFARRQDLKAQAVNIADLVRGMEELLRRSIGPLVRIETHFPMGLRRAFADANQLELALLNLAVNARDAMPGGGAITIAASEQAVETAEIGGLKPGKYIRLSVTDTGIGMDEATLARAHEPFFTTKGLGKGTGLGLSMVQGLAEQSGGKLVLKSQKGEGTTAEIWLPAAQVEPSAADRVPRMANPPAAPTGSRPLTVLAVDDDALVVMSTAALLEDLGHEAVEAHSGRRALEVLRSGKPIDMVITDQAMPGMTGTQLADTIRASWPELPIVLATGYAELPGDTGKDLIRLNKPFDQTSLARAIADSMNQGPGKSKPGLLQSDQP
jgi:PAS domain S-box-containing protein